MKQVQKVGIWYLWISQKLKFTYISIISPHFCNESPTRIFSQSVKHHLYVLNTWKAEIKSENPKTKHWKRNFDTWVRNFRKKKSDSLSFKEEIRVSFLLTLDLCSRSNCNFDQISSWYNFIMKLQCNSNLTNLERTNWIQINRESFPIQSLLTQTNTAFTLQYIIKVLVDCKSSEILDLL